MAYTVPTLATFRALYAEFAVVPDATVQAQLDDAAIEVTTSWLERDYPRAIMLLAAHRLLVSGAIDIALGRKSSMTMTGPITSKQVGDVRVTYAGAGKSSSSGPFYPDGFGATEYGRRYYDLLRRNFPAVLVV